MDDDRTLLTLGQLARRTGMLAGMAANARLWAVAVDPAGPRSGPAPLASPLDQPTKQAVTGHHAAAVVLARRGLGLGAPRRPGVPGPHRWMGTESYRPGQAVGP